MTLQQSALRRNRGFTLVETLIYIALFGVILGGVIVTAYPLITGAEKLGQRVTEEGEAAFVLRKIAWALNESAITSIDDSVAGTLTINRVSGPVSFTESGGVITIAGDPLTNERAVFSAFSATYDPPSSPEFPHTVEVKFDLGGETYSRTYHVFYQ